MYSQMSIFDFPEYLPEEDFSTMSIERAAEIIGERLGTKFKKDETHFNDTYSAKTNGFYIQLSFGINYQGKRILHTQVDYKTGGYGNPALSIDDSYNSIKRYMDNQAPQKSVCKYSGHECNKKELWRIAGEENPFCPHVCCRFCSEKLCGARCNGAAVPAELKDEDKAGKCEYCAWWNKSDGLRDTQGCMWKQHYPGHLDQDDLENHSCWLPQTKGMKVCATCKHSNDFIYDGDDMYHPVENNDLYCDLEDFHCKTPVNRRELFQEYRQRNFGVGYYHRQHEYDTCDLWEEDE